MHYDGPTLSRANHTVYTCEQATFKSILRSLKAFPTSRRLNARSTPKIQQPQNSEFAAFEGAPSTQIAEDGLVESIKDLQAQNRIFDTLPTLDEVLDPPEEVDICEI
ncbi:hypothetical protein BS17DRAFT_880175 [Gyrodon lividus]|nr:hypothetical protein BS17DRAFT_880175 [Gyrodon lividus]